MNIENRKRLFTERQKLLDRRQKLLDRNQKLLDQDFFNQPRLVLSDDWFSSRPFESMPVSKNDDFKWSETMILSVPDTRPENLKVVIKNGIMSLNGRSEKESNQNGSKMKSINQWSRELTIPTSIDQKSIEVELTGEQLKITSKKKEQCTVIPVTFE